MKPIVAFLITGFIFTSCGTRHEGEEKPSLISNLVSITDNEDKGVKEILQLYGGQCKYSFGFENSTRFFELELSGSEIVEKQSDMAEMAASNIAYTFYKNLKSEKSKYNEIRTTLVFADSQKLTLAYPTKQLELVQKKVPAAAKIVELIKRKDYDALKEILKVNEHRGYDANSMIEKIKAADAEFSNVTTGFVLYGFKVNQTKNGTELLHISGAIERDKQSNQFSADMDLNKSDDQVLFFQYKL